MQQNITGDMRIHLRLVYSYIGMYLEDSYLRLAQYVNLRAPTPSLLHAQSLARANMFRAPPSLPSHHITNTLFPRDTRLIYETMDTDMEIDPEIAAMMGFGSFGGNKKRKFGADDAFTDAQSGQQQESQQVASKANAIPVAEARSRPVVPVQAPPPGELPLLTFHLHYFYE
jgi:hypothetical protein